MTLQDLIQVCEKFAAMNAGDRRIAHQLAHQEDTADPSDCENARGWLNKTAETLDDDELSEDIDDVLEGIYLAQDEQDAEEERDAEAEIAADAENAPSEDEGKDK